MDDVREEARGAADGPDVELTREERLAGLDPETLERVLTEEKAARSVILAVATVSFVGLAIMVIFTLAVVAWKYWL